MKGIMLVVVLLLEIVLVENDDFSIFMKANIYGGVGMSTTVFASHLESSSCEAESCWYIYPIVRIPWELVGGL